MTNPLPSHLQQLLDKRINENSFRSLKAAEGLIDFCSNDYLGAAGSAKLHELISKEISARGILKNGSTGSRLLAGNSLYAEELENFITAFHYAEAAIVFNSGYDANLGLFSSIAGKDDTLICDELVHASIIDGCRLSKATRFKFRHNDLEDLKQKIKASKGDIFIVVESVYSMDGDRSPLKEMVDIAKESGAFLIVDEAHSTGIYGKEGRGLLNELNLEQEVFARIHTFGKALGVHGATIVGSKKLKDFLINYARSFIYSTALPFHSLAAIHCSYQWIKEQEENRNTLSTLIRHFKTTLKETGDIEVIESNSPIQSVLVPGNEMCREIAAKLQKKGYDIRAILSPTVPVGKERLRICIHSYNTVEEINGALNELALLMQKQPEA